LGVFGERTLSRLERGAHLKVHEYQAKEVLGRHGVVVPKGKIALSAEQAYAAAKEIGGTVVVKAQIHAGGRGKGSFTSGFKGGVKLAQTADEAAEFAKKMLGNVLVTHQTGPAGKEVQKVYVTEASDIAKEYYLGIVLDRAKQMNVIMSSTEGGVEIEKVAAETPEKILKTWIDPLVGIQPFHARQIAFGLGFKGEAFKECVKLVTALYKAHEETDATLTEINPLILTRDGHVLALDAKMNFDDNALYRHPDIVEMRDLSEEDALEIEASKYDLNYIRLNGNIGAMVNGAGLAMATMDLIKMAGAEPANFLDVGGGASEEMITRGFEIILEDEKVEAILINIFGGILRCDVLARGVVSAARKTSIRVPLIVRLEGTNVEEGRKILQESGLEFLVAKDMGEAAALVTQQVRKQ